MSRILTVASTGSTNDNVKVLAAAGEPEGAWLRAERQEAGRGRQGRIWTSGPGNLYLSTLVRLRETDPPAPALALVAAVALEQVVSALLGLPGAMIKWPNDLLVGPAKVAGILLEREGGAVVVGFGVNLAYAPDDLDRPATSLAAQGVAAEAEDVAEEVAGSFGYWLGRWRGGGPVNPVRARWMERAHPIGSGLSVRVGDGHRLEGLFEGLDELGALRLRLADASTRVIHAGDVSIA